MQGHEPSKVLEAWRDAERARDTAEPGTVEWERANTLANALRDEYQRAFDQQQSDDPLAGDEPGGVGEVPPLIL